MGIVVDTHIHVFVRGLPLAASRRYAPEYDATVEDYRARAHPHGITHAVIVQPSFLGTDNSFMRAALRHDRARLRGIAVVDPEIDDSALTELDADGVVGIRLNLEGLAIPDFRCGGWPRLLEAMRERGWHVETHRMARDLPALVGPLLDSGLDVVVDHFGRPDDDLGADDPGFRYLLAQGASRRLWVKLSGAYRNGSAGQGDAAAPMLAARLIEHLGADRLVWGSDWPHTRHESRVDLAAIRGAFATWVPVSTLRERIEGANALALYRFDA